MKKFIRAAVAAAALSMLSVTAMAQAFAIGTVGEGQVNINDRLDYELDRSDVAFKLGAGYQWPSGFLTEIDYFNFGRNYFSWPNMSARTRVSGVAATVGYQVTLTRDLGLRVRVGAASVKAVFSGTHFPNVVFSESESRVKPYGGVGLNWSLTQRVRVELAGDFTRFESRGASNHARAITLGVLCAF
jgi:outer membrane protein W